MTVCTEEPREGKCPYIGLDRDQIYVCKASSAGQTASGETQFSSIDRATVLDCLSASYLYCPVYRRAQKKSGGKAKT